MSNIVQIPSQTVSTPGNQWGVPSAAIPSYPVAPTKAPLTQPSQAQIPVISDQASVRNKFSEHTVRLQVLFSEKLNNLDGKVVTQKVISPSVAQQIFKPNTTNTAHDIHHKGEDSANSSVDLSKGIITRLSVLSTHNEYPFPVTFDFTSQGESSNCFSLDGNQFPLMLYPGEHSRGIDAEIYNAKSAVDDPFLRRYAHVSVEDMWGNIQTFRGQDYVYIPVDHEAVRLIKLNPDKFGPAPTQDDVREGKFYKIEGNRVATAIDELFYNVVSKFKFTDLGKFTVNMSRKDKKNFNDVSGSSWDHQDSQEQSFLMKSTLHAGFELKMTWTFPHQESQKSAVANPAVSQQYGFHQSPTFQSFNSKIPMS